MTETVAAIVLEKCCVERTTMKVNWISLLAPVWLPISAFVTGCSFLCCNMLSMCLYLNFTPFKYIFVSCDAVLLSPLSFYVFMYLFPFCLFPPPALYTQIYKQYSHYLHHLLGRISYYFKCFCSLIYFCKLMLCIVGSILITKGASVFLRDARSVCPSWKRKKNKTSL